VLFRSLPATSGSGAPECLVVNGQTVQTEQKVCGIVAALYGIGGCAGRSSPKIGEDQKAILEGIGQHIHLVGPELHTKADIVLSVNDVKGIGNRKHVRAALERSKSPVSKPPVPTSKDRRGQPATHAVRR